MFTLSMYPLSARCRHFTSKPASAGGGVGVGHARSGMSCRCRRHHTTGPAHPWWAAVREQRSLPARAEGTPPVYSHEKEGKPKMLTLIKPSSPPPPPPPPLPSMSLA